MPNASKKNEDRLRGKLLQTKVSLNEDERITWAAQEVGINKASFIRMAALKLAKEIVG